MAHFKIVLVGAAGVGKSAFLHRLRTGKYFKGTPPNESTTLRFGTTVGDITFDVVDVDSNLDAQQRAERIRDASGCIFMFDIENSWSYTSRWTDDVGAIPIVTCANKMDREVYSYFAYPHTKHTYDTSVYAYSNCIKPFMDLARQLTGNEKLEFTSYPAHPE